MTRNFSCKLGEIDLIMADSRGAVVFIEVKCRADEEFVDIETVLTNAKKTRMSKAAFYFLKTKKIEDRPFRFDFITVLATKSGDEQIRHYENAFLPCGI